MRTLPKWMLRASLSAVILTVMSMSSTIYALDSNVSVEFNIPFAFEDGSQDFPPPVCTQFIKSKGRPSS
jgi:hypothetical protein